MNLAGITSSPKIRMAALMATKIHMAAPTSVPSLYRRYQSHKIKPPIRLKGKPPKVDIPKGLSNPYREA